MRLSGAIRHRIPIAQCGSHGCRRDVDSGAGSSSRTWNTPSAVENLEPGTKVRQVSADDRVKRRHGEFGSPTWSNGEQTLAGRSKACSCVHAPPIFAGFGRGRLRRRKLSVSRCAKRRSHTIQGPETACHLLTTRGTALYNGPRVATEIRADYCVKPRSLEGTAATNNGKERALWKVSVRRANPVLHIQPEYLCLARARG